MPAKPGCNLISHIVLDPIITKMKLSIALTSVLLGSVSAFVPVAQNRARAGSVAVRETVDDLKKIAEKSNPVLKVSNEDRKKETIFHEVFAILGYFRTDIS